MQHRSCQNRSVAYRRQWPTLFCLLVALCLMPLSASWVRAGDDDGLPAGWPRMTNSRDGTPIAYTVYGQGEPTLVLVHGWSCDSRYWRMQVEALARSYRIVVVDLAGHGHSGMTRGRYTMRGFAEDVQAVVEQAAQGPVILVGHSMGGPVIAEAAHLLPGRVIGLIGVDTFDNIEYTMTRPQLDQMLAPLVANFSTGTRAFVEPMFVPTTDPGLRAWILDDMAAAPPFVALSALEEMASQHLNGAAAKIFEGLRVPVIAVNGDLWPIDRAANRRHMASFEAIVLKGCDHFLMLDRPALFNQALRQAIHTILRTQTRL